MKRRAFLHSFFGAAAGLISYPSRLPAEHEESKSVFVKIIGTAQDGGIPHTGCFCRNCRRAWMNSKHARFVSSLALFDLTDNKTFMVDVTPDIRGQTKMLRNHMEPKKGGNRYWPDGILLTHAHIGHYTGLMFYGYEALFTEKIPVCCSRRMADFLTHNGPWSQLVSQDNIVLQTMKPGEKSALTSRISVTPLLVPHRDEYSDTFGYRIAGPNGSILYIPDIHDWKIWDLSIADEAQKVDIALLDGTFFSQKELPSRDLSKIGHPFIIDSMELLRDIARNGKTRIFFTHLNHSNLALDPEGEARRTIEANAFALAEEGMEFPL